MNTQTAISKQSLTIQVFEHQVLRIGTMVNGVLFSSQHFEAFIRYHKTKQKHYFSLLHNGVRFSQYVGAIQVGNLTIEILPKADNYSKADKNLWQSFLLDLLKECRLLKLESVGNANLKFRSNSILDIYFELFLSEVEKLLQEGLIKSYRRKESNLKALKGRLVLPKHLRKNSLDKVSFFTNHEFFSFDNIYNQIIFQAIRILEKFLTQPILKGRLNQLKRLFPNVSAVDIKESDFEKLTFHRKTERYLTAIEIARLLIFQFSPDIKGGENNLVAILFDMNLLYEEFIYRSLKKWQTEDLIIKRQQRKLFWKRKPLKPDILIKIKDSYFVLDTKWKVLKKAEPSMEDLRQAFVYAQFFDAKYCGLLYPKVHNFENLNPSPFHFDKNNEVISCQIYFTEVIKAGKLNRNLGKEIILALIHNS